MRLRICRLPVPTAGAGGREGAVGSWVALEASAEGGARAQGAVRVRGSGRGREVGAMGRAHAWSDREEGVAGEPRWEQVIGRCAVASYGWRKTCRGRVYSWLPNNYRHV